MHIMAMDKGILGANGIVGGEIPIATGAAYSAKLRGTEQVTLAFFGDSASNEGTFHESINMLPPGTCPSSISLRTISSAFRWISAG